jgi:D-proline reductase (dithiol) PrdB
MTREVDSYKFIDPVSTRVMKAWANRERYDKIPWTPLSKPLGECQVALLSTAAIALNDDRPFDQQGERDNPWWGDPSHRVIPADARTADVTVYHMHIDTRPAEQDLNCVLPLARLAELAEQGLVGRIAASHYSIMGYILDETELLGKTAPKIVSQLLDEAVDAVVLVPV